LPYSVLLCLASTQELRDLIVHEIEEGRDAFEVGVCGRDDVGDEDEAVIQQLESEMREAVPKLGDQGYMSTEGIDELLFDVAHAHDTEPVLKVKFSLYAILMVGRMYAPLGLLHVHVHDVPDDSLM
jgi:hypothetical protein